MKESKYIEVCDFHINENKYSVYLNTLGGGGTSILIEVDNKKSATGISTRIRKRLNEINVFESIDRFTPYSTKNDGICNPLRM